MKLTASDCYSYVCEGGVVTGFGHLTRQSALIEVSSQWCSSVSCCVLDDDKQSLIHANEIVPLDTKYLFSTHELNRMDFHGGSAFVDGARIDIDSLGWRNIELCVVMSPLIRIPTIRSASFFRGYKVPANWIPKKGDIIELGARYAVVPTYVNQLRVGSESSPHIVEDRFVLTLMLGEMVNQSAWQAVKLIMDELIKYEHLIIQVPQNKVRTLYNLWNSEKIDRVEILTFNPKSPWSQIMNTNLMVTSGGQSMVESLCLGFPTISIPVRLEQRDFVEDLQIMGAVVAFTHNSYSPVGVEGVIREVRDQETRLELSTTARRVIDGLGASRIHNVILETLK